MLALLCWIAALGFQDQAARLVVQSGHSARLTSLAAEPSGQYLVSTDSTHACLWSESGLELAKLTLTSQQTIRSVAWAPTRKEFAIAGGRWINLFIANDLQWRESSPYPTPILRINFHARESSIVKIRFDFDQKHLWLLSSVDQLFRVPLDRDPLQGIQPSTIATKPTDVVASSVSDFDVWKDASGAAWSIRGSTDVYQFSSGSLKPEPLTSHPDDILDRVSCGNQGVILGASRSILFLRRAGKGWAALGQSASDSILSLEVDSKGQHAVFCRGNKAFVTNLDTPQAPTEILGRGAEAVATFSGEHSVFAIGYRDRIVLTNENGKLLSRGATGFKKLTVAVNGIALSKDSGKLASCSGDGHLLIWEAVSGRPKALPHSAAKLLWSPDANWLIGTHPLIGGFAIDSKSGQHWSLPPGLEEPLFVSNSTFVSIEGGKSIRAVSLDSRRTLWRASLPPNSRALALGRRSTTSCWLLHTQGNATIVSKVDVTSGKLSEPAALSGHLPILSRTKGAKFERLRQSATQGAFSADGTTLVTLEPVVKTSDGEVPSEVSGHTGDTQCYTVWTSSGKCLGANLAHAAPSGVALAPTGAFLVVRCDDGSVEYIRLSDLQAGRPWALRIVTSGSHVTDVEWGGDAEEPDLLLATEDGLISKWSHDYLIARLRNNSDGRGTEDDILLGGAEFSLIAFPTGEWAAILPDGRFDASNAGQLDGIHWIIRDRVATMETLATEYYVPALLAGLDPDVDATVPQINSILVPDTPLIEVDGDELVIKLRSDASLEAAWLEVNGVVRLELDRTALHAGPMRLPLTHPAIANARRSQAGADNTVRVLTSYSRPVLLARNEGQQVSRAGSAASASLSIGPSPTSGPSRIFALVVSAGYSSSPPLLGALRDARKFVELLSGISNNVEVQLIASTPAGDRVSREKVIGAFENIVSSKPSANDLVLVFFAGHGTVEDENYAFITDQKAGERITWDDIRTKLLGPLGRAAAISGSQLDTTPMPRVAFIVDTCYAGSLASLVGKWRSADIELAREAQQLGLFVLAATKDGQTVQAFESTVLQHGIMTYSLLDWACGSVLASREANTHLDLTPVFQTGVGANPLDLRVRSLTPTSTQLISCFNVPNIDVILGPTKREIFETLLSDVSTPIMFTPDLVDVEGRDGDVAESICIELARHRATVGSPGLFVWSDSNPRGRYVGYRFVGRYATKEDRLEFSVARIDARWYESGVIREESIDLLPEASRVALGSAASEVANSILKGIKRHSEARKVREPKPSSTAIPAAFDWFLNPKPSIGRVR